MKILAIETASPPGSIALLDGLELVSMSRLESTNRTTREFAPLIRDQLRSAGWSPKDVHIVAVDHGPGSFTGLRIGITAAKVFAYAVGGQVVGIDTLQTIASQCATTDGPIEAVLDAQRNQLFAARFQHIDGELQLLQPARIMDNQAWLESLAEGTTVIGTGLKKIRTQLPKSVHVADEIHWAPRADSLGQLAFVAAQRSEALMPMELTPKYLRKSAAEEKMSGP